MSVPNVAEEKSTDYDYSNFGVQNHRHQIA